MKGSLRENYVLQISKKRRRVSVIMALKTQEKLLSAHGQTCVWRCTVFASLDQSRVWKNFSQNCAFIGYVMSQIVLLLIDQASKFYY